MNIDPRDTISRSPMSMMQIIAVAITIGLNGLDGFDVLSISFAGPGIMAEWGIDRGALGFVLSMELIGMAVGSLVLGPLADKIGRRPLMLGCLVLMAIGMFLAPTAKGVYDLSCFRILTGLGIGGLLAAINAVAAEFSNLKRRHLCVSIMAIGYPIGAVLGGIVVQDLLKGDTWRSVFHFGAWCTVAFIPLVWLFIPESVHWLTRKQPVNALEKINKTLRRMGRAAISALPTISEDVRKRSVSDLFAPALIGTTILVAVGYFFHVTTFYFILKWIPNIVSGMGFAPSSAAGVLVWANVGGALGGAVLGLLTLRFSVKGLTIAAMLMSSVMVAIFGRTPPDLQKLSLMVACAGFFTNGAIVGMYAIFAQAFPTQVRASGTGFAIGVGRGGSVLAPIIAGLLFRGGAGLPAVAMTMAVGSLLAAVVVSRLRLRPDEPAADASAGDGPRTASLSSAPL
ncbi:MAG TPA: MFS transporter [Steroidobacteraceae bacterium]|nr:MFS transporter [Steroidobacteraceae bacterium]